MKILSLFDWMACWYEALVRAWIPIDKYYASEVDKYAIQIATKNHPDIIEIWDVCEVKWEDYQDIDLLIWGSPCQWFSKAGKLWNFEDSRSKLFYEYVRLLREIKPKYFLLENVAMKKEWQDIISRELWVEPIEINSSLVSAQYRRRLYRTNIPSVSQPKDRWIKLRDITDKAVSDLITYVDWELRIRQATKQWYIVAEEWDWVDLSYPKSKTRRGRVSKDKSNTITTQWELYVCEKILRKLTPIECERLQTLPDNYTQWVSDTQRYKMLGNGWTVDVISHIFSFIPKEWWHTEN